MSLIKRVPTGNYRNADLPGLARGEPAYRTEGIYLNGIARVKVNFRDLNLARLAQQGMTGDIGEDDAGNPMPSAAFATTDDIGVIALPPRTLVHAVGWEVLKPNSAAGSVAIRYGTDRVLAGGDNAGVELDVVDLVPTTLEGRAGTVGPVASVDTTDTEAEDPVTFTVPFVTAPPLNPMDLPSYDESATPEDTTSIALSPVGAGPIDAVLWIWAITTRLYHDNISTWKQV